MTREQWLKLSATLGAGAMVPHGVFAALLADDELKRSDFGRDFIWGAATAAYQIEGAWNEDGKGENIWDHFSHYTKKVHAGETGDVADDFYHRYESDIELMKKMNIPAFRFSLSWSRIIPQGTGPVNQKGIDFYNKVIDKCLKEGIEPWVTCYHWDLPQALEEKGGWTNREIIKWFEDYVEVCAKNFGDRVKNWMVFNEPVVFTALGYLMGIHAPGRFGLKPFFPAVHHTVMSQSGAGRVLRKLVKNGNIGTTFSCSHVEPWKDKKINQKGAVRTDAMMNRLFVEPALGMGYPYKDLPALKRIKKYIQPGDEEKMAFDFDFIGVQNYIRVKVKRLDVIPIVHSVNIPTHKLGHEATEMNWEVFPEGIYRILKQFGKYNKKIIVTENGAAFRDEIVNGEINDPKRVEFLKGYIKNVLRAKNEGVNIGGYFVWSFLDNFEWSEGYRRRFGIVGVDYKTQQRIVKASGKWYSDFLSKK